MSLRKTACYSCVAAKRRCDKALPACQRCRHRSLSCLYPYPPETPPTSEILEARPQSKVQTTTTPLYNHGDHLDDSMIFQDLGPEIDFDSIFVSEFLLQEDPGPEWDHKPNRHDASKQLMPLQRRVLQFWARIDDIQTWSFCVQSLLLNIDAFVQSGSNTFVHPSQDAILQPSLRTAFGVCAAYKTQTDANRTLFSQLLESEVQALIAGSLTGTFAEKLAILQALILYHTVMLFSGDRHHQNLAEQQEILLAQWTAELEKTQSRAPCSADDSPALYESARRAIMISYFLRCVYHVLKYQTCSFIVNLMTLPVSKHCHLGWSTEQAQTFPTNPGSGVVVSYHEFVQDWEDKSMSNVDDFALLLLVACKGVGAISERLPTVGRLMQNAL
ncbi:putative C6 finger domain protein [Xylogone sp. PMI_703]|nr:putative C6 finger domain protein [Xylogone sp. PMI_703]